MVLSKAARASILALFAVAVCFGANEAQDRGETSEQIRAAERGGKKRELAQASNEISAKSADERGCEAQNLKGEKRYFRSCSCLHKQKSNKPVYLYDEISSDEALNSADTAYFVGYFKDGALLRYEKIYAGKRVFCSEDLKP